MQPRCFVLVHGDDIDGVGSAAIIRMKLGAGLKDIFFTDYTRERVLSAARSIAKGIRGSSLLIVADLGDSLLEYLEPLLGLTRREGSYSIWLDHHAWSKESIDKASKLCDLVVAGENRYACATEIASAVFDADSAFARKFKEIVHYSDMNIDPRNAWMRKLIKEYALSITSYTIRPEPERTNALRRMVSVISGGRLIDKRIERDAAKFEYENNARIKKMTEEAVVIGDMVFGFADGVQSSYACSKLMEGKRDIGVLISPATGKVSMRSRKKDILQLANAFGGGGHPHAAGFSIRKPGKGDTRAWRWNAIRRISRVAEGLGLIRPA